jgi:hypothetical protein
MSASVGSFDSGTHDLQTDLAKVNLLRIRGDFASAKTLCLSILKHHPDSVDAHVMMGDLHAEQADLPPAAEWYSLALDLDRNAPGVNVKLSRIQAAMDVSKQATVTKALVQTGKKTSPWLFVAAGATALSIASIAYIAGLKNPPKGTTNNFIREKISAPANPGAPAPVFTQNTGSGAVQLPNTPTKEPTVKPNEGSDLPVAKTTGNPATNIVAQDQTLFEQVYQRTTYSKNLISIMVDPRTSSMILTYNVKSDEHGRYVGAVLADVAMEYDTKAGMVTLRGVRNGILSYMGDVTREKIIEVETDAGKDVKDIEDKSWIDKVLTNEYFKDKEAMKPLPM